MIGDLSLTFYSFLFPPPNALPSLSFSHSLFISYNFPFLLNTIIVSLHILSILCFKILYPCIFCHFVLKNVFYFLSGQIIFLLTLYSQLKCSLCQRVKLTSIFLLFCLFCFMYLSFTFNSCFFQNCLIISFLFLNCVQLANIQYIINF